MVEIVIFRNIAATTISTVITPLLLLLLTWDQNKGLAMLDCCQLSFAPISSTRVGTV